MMKKLLYVFAFIFVVLLFNGIRVSAKVSESEIFEIEVGKEDVLDVNYTLEEDSNKNLKERINFAVTLRGVSEVNNNYRWEHVFCYALNGGEEVCEIDFTGSDQEKPQYIYSNKTYDFSFYDTDMPYYSEDLFFDYVVFKNKLVCLDCDSNSEIVLEDIRFEKEDIDYSYNYEIEVEHFLNEGKKYIENYYNTSNINDKLVYLKFTFINHSYSDLAFSNLPIYKMINEVCIGENDCEVEELGGESSNQHITPYSGSWYAYYTNDSLVYVDNKIVEENVKIKSKFICYENCSSRRVKEEILVNDIYYFDDVSPFTDGENTVVFSVDEYKKSVKFKIKIDDLGSGVNSDSLMYYLGWNNNGSCSYLSRFYFENDIYFSIGENLKDGSMCMYYVASDNLGNSYTSETYYLLFDNKGPLISINNPYDSSKYYNEIKFSPSFSDSYSGLKETYYLWSEEVINEENYLLVKENGALFNGNISSRELEKDGNYYLYFLSLDNVGNYSFIDLGLFKIDTIGLELNEVIVETSGFNDDYSNIGVVKLTIDQINDGEEFKCGFFNSDNVSVSDLTVSCYNKQEFNVPSGYEGEYDLFVYVRDRASNYSLFKVKDNLKIDTKAPSVDYSILYNDDEYRIINEVTLNVSDLSGVNANYLKYGWFERNKTNVVSGDLIDSFNNGGTISYPKGKYGEYRLYMLVIDNIGNEKVMPIDKIFKIDTDIINISLIGEKSITILKGESYIDLGATAYKGDIINGGRVSDVVVYGEVDSSKEGIYYITYTSGEGDLLVSVTREVIVKSNSVYIISSVSFFVIGGVVICLRLFIRKRKGH